MFVATTPTIVRSATLNFEVLGSPSDGLLHPVYVEGRDRVESTFSVPASGNIQTVAEGSVQLDPGLNRVCIGALPSENPLLPDPELEEAYNCVDVALVP